MTKRINTDGVGGHFLCSGHLKDFRAVGELGQSVYQIAFALREAIRRNSSSSSSPLEYFLAIPQANSNSQEVDWYADERLNTADNSDTSVVNWNQATPIEQEVARQKLLDFEQRINQLSQKLLEKSQGKKGDLFTFANLLPKTLITPSELKEISSDSSGSSARTIEPSYIYLVGAEQHPVLAFWGFSTPNADTSAEPFHFLRKSISTPVQPAFVASPASEAPPTKASIPASTAAAPPTTTPPPLAPKRNWSWLRWLLLGLLLLFFLFFVWRSCSRPSLPALSTPSISAPSLPNVPTTPQSLWGMRLPNWFPSFGLKPGTSSVSAPQLSMPNLPTPTGRNEPSAALSPVSPSEPGSALRPSTDPSAATAAPPFVEPPATTAASPSTAPSATTAAAPPNLTSTAAPPQLGAELQIPPQLANESTPSYLNGDWQVHAIQDQTTGRPIRLEYSIQDGEGLVRVHQSNGTNCLGSVQASGLNAGMQINSTSQAQCNDGSSYEMPQVECKLNAHQETECFGRYGNQTFPISMRHAVQ